MLSEFRQNAYFGIALGFVVAIIGRVVARSDAPMPLRGVGTVIALVGWTLFIWGCCYYAKAKGFSGWWGLLGLLSIVGLLILLSFPDRYSTSMTHDMQSRSLLRALIVAEIGLGVVGVAVSVLTESSLPEPLQTYVEAEAESDTSDPDAVMLAIGVPLIILWLVSIVGLFFFWRPARILYVMTMVVDLVTMPYFGPYVATGWVMMFDEIPSHFFCKSA